MCMNPLSFTIIQRPTRSLWIQLAGVLLLDASGQPLVETAGSVLNNGALCRLVDPLLQLIKSSVRLHRACGGLNV